MIYTFAHSGGVVASHIRHPFKIGKKNLPTGGTGGGFFG